MEVEDCGEDARRIRNRGLCVDDDFLQMVEVANGWIADFMCYCLYRYFKAGMYAEFRLMRDTMNGLLQHPSITESIQTKKVHICQILSRIVEGKNLDVQFDQDESITPLESALLVLIEMADDKQLKKDALYSDLKQLLQVQSVAVCMEKGDFKRASEVLEREFQENLDSDQPLKRTLSSVISKKDLNHKFLNKFDNERLVDVAASLANKLLIKEKSQFLVQAATKVVQSRKRDADAGSSDVESICEHTDGKWEDLSRGETDDEANSAELNTHRSRRQLYSFVAQKGWKPVKSEAVKDFGGKRKRLSVKKKKFTSREHLVGSKKQNTSSNSEVPRKKRVST
ncbi:telomeric repeat-binding factor 1 isoform X1 [Rhincodon typus]|uniref:telomeric repeat-binding factor 1 isoform X1 n=1 Tax=Rhincodon typus TaxID=259920 RepID=UPI0020304D14|nr:telomeric repeat-binding factor 1 isoform X1 [Rhincodon typus]